MDGKSTEQKLNTLLRRLYDDDQEVRISAIDQLGDIGDELCLMELRKQLKYISREQEALIIAVGKLKRELHVK